MTTLRPVGFAASKKSKIIAMPSLESKGKVVVTGGSGYVGRRVAAGLNDAGFEVVVFDRVAPPDEGKFEFVQGDICDRKALSSATRGAAAVVHAAATGFAGRSALPAYDGETRRVNVGGTRAVLDACVENSVKALVLTSSVNVGFDGSKIVCATESDVGRRLTVFGERHLDEYSRSKFRAEQVVLTSEGDVRTCALRLGGIYGPGERYILPRALQQLRWGLHNWIFCLPEGHKLDFVHVDNAVQAHVKAVSLLLDEDKHESVNRQAFHITDGRPMSNKEFVQPLHRAMFDGRPFAPTVTVPKWLLLVFAFCYQFDRDFTARFMWSPRMYPFWGINRAEARLCTVTHVFSIDKARKILGYDPDVDEDRQWGEIIASLGIGKKVTPVTYPLWMAAMVFMSFLALIVVVYL